MADETVLHQWFERVWNQGNEAAIDELAVEDFVTHGLEDPSGKGVTGRETFKPFFRQLRAAFPDMHFTIEDAVTQGDKVWVRCRVTAGHTGPGVTATPTNRRVDFTGMCVARVKDGRIVEGWNNFDLLTMYRQLGMELR